MEKKIETIGYTFIFGKVYVIKNGPNNVEVEETLQVSND